MSFSKTKYQKSYRILGLIFAVIMVSFLSARKCQAVTLTITANNGSVTATPDKAQYDVGEVVELRPKPDTGYYFAGWAGDAQGKRLVLNLKMDSDKTITANFDTWQPPIGIPAPEFGIFETYRMYDDPANRSPELTYTQNAEDGFYTHYVDNTHPNATDSSNPYGTAAKPRLTIPLNLPAGFPAGSVVEVHGGPYSYIDRISIVVNGTADMPIFIRGEESKTELEELEIILMGRYAILENLYMNNQKISVRILPSLWAEPSHDHLSIRNFEIEGGGVFINPYSDYIVVYNNHIHHHGDAYALWEDDRAGVAVNGGPNHYIWVVDNHIHHNGGDSFLGGHTAAHTTSHIYIGRNEMHGDGENAVDLKDVTDVIVSQNTMYDYPIRNPSSNGFITVTHEGYSEPPEERGAIRSWYIYNEMYDAALSAFRAGGLSRDTYFIGNIVHDIQGEAFSISTPEDTYHVGNTMYNVDNGIRIGHGAGGTTTIVNNIFGNLSDSGGAHINLGEDYKDDAVVSNNLFQEPRIIDTGCVNCIDADPQFVDATNGDFHLQPASPAIDAGTSSGVAQEVFDRFEELYGIDIRKDIEGKPRTGAWDIGAYEYVQGPALFLSSTIGGSVTNPGEGSFPYDDGTVVSIEATADEYYYFVNWTGTAVDAGKVANASAASTTVTVDAAYTIQAVFDTDLNTLTISSTTGGSVSNPGEGLFLYDDEVVPIQATADQNYHFVNWTGTGAGQVADPDSAATTVTMDADYAIQANFAIDQRDLMITSTSGGSVTTPGEGTYQYDHGTVASVVAAPAANYHFVNWTGTAVGAGKVANANAASTTVTMDAAYAIQANFAIDQHTLTISSAGGGTVTDPGEGDFLYDYGTDVPIQATAGGSSYFVNWTGTAVAADKVANPNAAGTTVTVDAAYTIQANFGDPDGIAPTVTNYKPAADSIQAPLNSLIILHVTDAGIGVAAGSVTITLDGDTIYTGDSSEYSSATGICRRIGTPADFTYAYQSSQSFDFDEIKTVTVDAADLGGIAMTQESYFFTTEMRSFGQNKQASSGLDNLNSDRPVTVCDTDGNIWAVWHTGPVGSRNVYVAKLTAGADAFDSSVQIRSNSSDQANPAISLGTDDKLYVVWQDNRQADDNNQGEWDIYVSTSVDGTSWSAETRVNDPNEDNQINPAIVVDSRSPNYAYVAWQDDRAGNQDICIATSSNGFATPTVSQITSNSSNQVEPAVAADSDNTIYVVWTDMRNGSSDIYGAASNNPWTNVAIVSNTNNQSSPAIAAESAGSILHLLWVDDTPGDNDIYYASLDGLPGSPLTGSSIIDDSSGADQLEPTIAVTGSTGDNLKVFACWQDWRNTDTDLYFAELSAGSGTNVFVGDSGSNADQGEPAIGIDEYSYPYLIWADSGSTNTDIYYAGSTFIEPVALASELVTASASSSTTVGTDPPAITILDDVSVVVPGGACSYDVTITVSKIANPLAFPAPCLGGYDFGPSGIQFSQPVTITIPYAFSSSDSSVTPYWFNLLTGALSQQGITDIQDIPISSSLHALSFKTTHFTAFYLLVGGGSAAAIVGGGGGGGCSVSASGEGNIVEFILPYGALALFMLILRWRDRKYRKDFGETLYRENE